MHQIMPHLSPKSIRQEAQQLAAQGISRARITEKEGEFTTMEIKPQSTQPLFDAALKQIQALQSGTESPRGTYIHKEIPQLENPMYKDF